MALPTAVRKNAELARKRVAESTGAKAAPASSPQASDGEYLSVSTDTSQAPSQSAQVGVVSADVLASQKAAEQASLPQGDKAPPVDDNYRPHILSEGALPVDAHAQHNLGRTDDAPSKTDTANPSNPGHQSGDFIDPENWKARFTALRSSRDARVSDLEQQVSQYKSENEHLKGQLAPKDEPAANRFTLDEETRSNLGEDQAKAFDQFNDSVEQRFAQRDEEQREVTQKEIRRFESDLESLVPRWREINVDQNWLSWLTQQDEVMQVRRQDMLDSFVRDRDASSVAALFRSFAVRGAQGQQRNGHSPSPELSATRAGSGLGAEESMVEVWSQSEISDFYHAKNRLYQSGKLKGAKLEEVMAEEAKIRKAMEEGRVDMKT